MVTTRKEAILWSGVVLMIFGSMSLARDQRPYLGVSLDPAPLPELLVKHLHLDPGQGIRINNLTSGGPADEAGLDRDDIILAFQGEKVTAIEPFIEAVRQAGVGAEISLEILHLGEHKTVPLKLLPQPETIQWKYPPETEAVTAWRPGRIFRIGPDGREMMEIPFDKFFQSIPRLDRERLAEQKDRALEKLQEQMEQLQSHMKELQERNRELFDRLLRKKDKKENQSAEPETPPIL